MTCPGRMSELTELERSKQHCGPRRATCVACGQEIGAYESRYFGPEGAVHAWDSSLPKRCPTNKGREDRFPYYYTDG